MKVTESTIRKLTITNVSMLEDLGELDPIAVMVEDFGPGQGKITITCFNDAWSYYWGSMGDTTKLVDFFCGCDEHYLAGKLKGHIDAWIRDDNPASVERALKAEIIKDRRQGALNKDDAQGLWRTAELLSESIANNAIGSEESELLFDVFGDEWWHRLPKRPNPNYEYLCRIIKTVQVAFKQLKEAVSA